MNFSEVYFTLETNLKIENFYVSIRLKKALLVIIIRN